jgi:hypothetical protein
MSAKSILEADGKAILNYHLTRAPVIKPTPLPPAATHNPPSKLASLHFAADEDIKGVLDQAEATYPWLLTPGSKFVAKPDQLIKRRGKSGLLALNKTWPEAREWIEARAGKEQRVETVDGVLRQFLVEPFVPHPQDTEYYININSVREVRLFPISTSFCNPVFMSFRGSASSGVYACVQKTYWNALSGKLQRKRERNGKLAQIAGALPGFVTRPAGRRDRWPTHSCKAPTLLRYARPLSHANVAALSALCAATHASSISGPLVLRLLASALSCQYSADLTANLFA